MAISQRAVEAPACEPARRPCAGAGLASEQGFTLIEVLVAATLLIVSVLATLAMVDRATATTAVGKQRDVANALAQEMIERAAGGRYTDTRNDLTDVDPAAALPGPADRLRAALDPDGDQASSALAPATATSGSLPVNQPQTWSLLRKRTVYTVSYRACSQSDSYQGIQILGPFDCSRSSTPISGTGPGDTATSGGCSVGVIPPGAVDPANPGQLTVKFQLLGITGVSACVGAISAPLSSALCTLLGTSPLLDTLKNSLLGANGSLTQVLGGLGSGASAGVCASQLTEAGLAGANAGIATSTRVVITVAWTGGDGKARSIDQSALIRKAVNG